MQHPSLNDRYNKLKERLSYYLLLQVYTFLNTSGTRNMGPAMDCLIEKAADINIREAQVFSKSKYAEALGSALAKHMGETFNSKYDVEIGKDHCRIVLEDCGCIGSLLKTASEFGFTDSVCRSIFCGACLGGYRLSAKKLGLKFEGSLTPLGCWMTFITPPQ